MDFWLEALTRTDEPAEFPVIELTRGRGDRAYKGPGSVVRTASGRLAMKFYSHADFRDAFRPEQLPAGTIVPKADLFDMESMDTNGHSWASGGISARLDYSISGTAVVHAEPHRLVGRRPSGPKDRQQLSVAICTDAVFPINQKEQTERKVGEKLVSANYNWGAAEFDADDLHVRVLRDGKLLVLQAFGEWPVDTGEELAEWMVSALQFTLGRRLIADVVSLHGGQRRIQIIRSVDRERLRPRIEPPRHWRSRAEEGATWAVFISFLKFLRCADRSKAKELCRWSAEVVDSGGAALEVSSLVLSVAVEGIVGLLLRKETRNKDLTEAVQLSIKIAEAADFPKNLKPRILGAIEAMKNPRARDYLEGLVQDGVIPKAYLDAWKALRNSAAHADAADGAWIEPVLRKSGIVLALYYRLVFLLIGYQGPYTDYGEIGWPERNV